MINEQRYFNYYKGAHGEGAAARPAQADPHREAEQPEEAAGHRAGGGERLRQAGARED